MFIFNVLASPNRQATSSSSHKHSHSPVNISHQYNDQYSNKIPSNTTAAAAAAADLRVSPPDEAFVTQHISPLPSPTATLSSSTSANGTTATATLSSANSSNDTAVVSFGLSSTEIMIADASSSSPSHSLPSTTATAITTNTPATVFTASGSPVTGTGTGATLPAINTESTQTYVQCVSSSFGEKIAKTFSVPYFETSAKDDLNVENAFHSLVSTILEASDYSGLSNGKISPHSGGNSSHHNRSSASTSGLLSLSPTHTLHSSSGRHSARSVSPTHSREAFNRPSTKSRESFITTSASTVRESCSIS